MPCLGRGVRAIPGWKQVQKRTGTHRYIQFTGCILDFQVTAGARGACGAAAATRHLAPIGAEKVALVANKFFEKISGNKWPFFDLFLKEIPMLWGTFHDP